MKTTIHQTFAAFCSLFLLVSVSFAHGDEFTKPYVDSLVPSYLSLQKALAADDLANAKNAATNLNVAAMKGPKFEEFTDFVSKIITARDLNEARTAFVEVSAELITVIDHVGTTGGTTLFTAHCPMAFGGKGADWVQGDKKVMNPYFGGKMPHCGSINDQVAGKMSDKVDAKLPPGGQHAHGNP